ncbi:hypothetical protein KM1_192180 [Entamoeba histolytica HM-3:IMSS]|uniref:Uncharacterized protein n=1 Tax=Entamoeba histolytica HM-3:IMSS TaxID=885315 RepID=M7X621_ENTHI|nr:hypothetical protein KM1_192180 [Entamoeba histolytica HM-3:IMSS]
MFGTVSKQNANTRNNSEEETEFEYRRVLLSDFSCLLNDIKVIGSTARILGGGIDLSFEGRPLFMFNNVINKHIKLIEELGEHIAQFRKNNRLILEELKKEREREKREKRIDEAEKKKEEETKPERRKTRPL